MVGRAPEERIRHLGKRVPAGILQIKSSGRAVGQCFEIGIKRAVFGTEAVKHLRGPQGGRFGCFIGVERRFAVVIGERVRIVQGRSVLGAGADNAV